MNKSVNDGVFRYPIAKYNFETLFDRTIITTVRWHHEQWVDENLYSYAALLLESCSKVITFKCRLPDPLGVY